jgi:hypothetical protein
MRANDPRLPTRVLVRNEHECQRLLAADANRFCTRNTFRWPCRELNVAIKLKMRAQLVGWVQKISVIFWGRHFVANG